MKASRKETIEALAIAAKESVDIDAARPLLDLLIEVVHQPRKIKRKKHK